MTMGQGGIFGNPGGVVTTPTAPSGGFDIQGLLGNPLFNIGTGLLVAGLDNPRNFGQALGRGLQFGTQQMNAAQGRQLAQAKLAAHREAMEENARRRAASERLKGLLVPPGTGEAREPQPGDQQRQMLGLLADIAPEQFAQGLLSSMTPQKPTNLQREYEFLISQGVRPEKALESLKKGTVVNVGDKSSEPLKVTDLKSLRLPDGSPVPLGASLAQAQAAGAKVLTNEQIKAMDAADKFSGVLDRLETLALGTDGKPGVFSDVKPGLANRAKSGLDLFLGSLNRDKPNIESYESLSQGTIAPFIKQLGESGALAEGDVARGLALLPQIRGEFLLPDTQEDARNKLNALREILERGEKNLRGKLKGGKTEKSPRVTPGAIGRMGLGEIGNVDVNKLDAAGRRALDKRLKDLGF